MVERQARDLEVRGQIPVQVLIFLLNLIRKFIVKPRKGNARKKIIDMLNSVLWGENILNITNRLIIKSFIEYEM